MENDAFHGELPEGGYRTVARPTSSRSSRLFFEVYMLTILRSVQYINGHREVLQLKRWQSHFLRVKILCKILFPLDKDRYGSLIHYALL